MRSFSMIRSAAVAVLLVASVACTTKHTDASATTTASAAPDLNTEAASAAASDSAKQTIGATWHGANGAVLDLSNAGVADMSPLPAGVAERGQWAVDDGGKTLYLSARDGDPSKTLTYTVVTLTPHQLVLRDAHGAETTYTK